MFSKYTNLTSLEFANNFDQQLIPNMLPNTLTYLNFGYNYNRSLNDILPNNLYNLQHLVFGCKFNQSIAGILPKNLTKLEFRCGQFNQTLFEEINGSPVSVLPKA